MPRATAPTPFDLSAERSRRAGQLARLGRAGLLALRTRRNRLLADLKARRDEARERVEEIELAMAGAARPIGFGR